MTGTIETKKTAERHERPWNATTELQNWSLAFFFFFGSEKQRHDIVDWIRFG
jgi:hypothetical protein